jgi:capsular polysaccharide biosynthesis protein
MDLRGYLRLLRRGWPVVLALVVLGVAAGVGLTLATTKVYRADVQTIVSASSISSTSDLAQGNSFVQQSVQSYTSIANSPTVTDAVVKKPGVNLTPAELAAKISADAPLNKVLINLHVTDTDPQRAARLANLVAARFVTAVQDVAKTDASGKSVVKITVIHPATIPTDPIKPSLPACSSASVSSSCAMSSTPPSRGRAISRTSVSRCSVRFPSTNGPRRCRSPSAAIRTACARRPIGNCAPTCSSSTSTTHRASSR